MSVHVTPSQLQSISNGKAKANIINPLSDLINQYGKKYRITSSIDELTQFLGQTALESAGFSVLTENLNYSAKRLTQVWPNRYKTLAAAQPYANNQQKLANHTYGGRLGNTGPNDGWLYRGRGIKQLTGKYNYTEFTKWMRTIIPDCPDFVKNPDLVAEFPWAFWSAVYFWFVNKVYLKAKDTRAATIAINGGTNGLNDRVFYVNRAKKVIVDTPGTTVSKTPPAKPDLLLKQYQEKLNKISEYRKDKTLNVGKADGWNGPKTTKATKAFQKSTGFLKQDGILGKETREAIDNVLEQIELAIKAPLEDIFIEDEPTIIEDVIVQEIPEELENADKPLAESKTIWTVIMGALTSIWTFIQMGVDTFLQLEPYVQITIIVMVTILIILAYRTIQDRRKTKKGVEELKSKAKELLAIVNQ